MEKGAEKERGELEEDVEAPKLLSSPSFSSPPDGGWGWVIVFGGGIAFSLVAGVNKSISFFYEEFLQRFGQSASATAWVISISGTVRMISSPVVSALCTRLSHRAVGMSSCFVLAAAFICAAFAPSLPYLYFTFAILYGFGANMYIVPQLSMVNMYFLKKRGKANALNTCFIGIGGFYVAPLMAHLFHEYRYQGALFILSALSLHHIPCAALYRPLQAPSQRVVNYEGTEALLETKAPSNLSIAADEQLNDNIQTIQTQNGDLENKTSQDKGMSQGTKKSSILSRIIKAVCAFARLLGLNGLTNFNLCSLCFLMVGFGIANTCNVSVLAGLAFEKGFTVSQVTQVMAINAATEIPFRLLSGFVFDCKLIRKRRPQILGFLGAIAGIILATQPFVPGVIPSMISWPLYQGFSGAFNSQSTTVMSDIVDKSQITSALGIIRLLQGLGNLIGPLIGGVARDMSGSYKLGYVIAGSLMAIISTSFSIVHIIRKKVCVQQPATPRPTPTA